MSRKKPETPSDPERAAFLQLARLPGRLSQREAAWLLGFDEADLGILEKHRMLTPLGKSAGNCRKYYAANYVEALRLDPRWLERATTTMRKHWRERNANKASPDDFEEDDAPAAVSASAEARS